MTPEALETAETGLARPQSFTALREIARSLSAAWELDTTLDLIARKTTEVMAVDSCTIYLLDPDSRTLRMRASTGLARQALGLATLLIGEGMTGYAVQENRPVHASDAQQDPHFKWVDGTGEVRFQSLLAVPLVLEGRPIGALNVQTLQTHWFSEDEVEVLSLIGELAAGALVKAQLYDRQRRQLDELRTLAEVSEAVTSPQYLHDILDVVTALAARTIGASACSVHLLGEERLPAAAGERVSLSDDLLAEVAGSGRPAYVSVLDVEQDARLSLLAVPLSVQDRVIGVLACATPGDGAFSDSQESLLLTLANQTALAIENARLVGNAAVVREMHHRIKNNLQTIAMLMQLQLPEARHQETIDVLRANMGRVRSIAAVHEILSEQGFRLVDVKSVLEQISRSTLGGLSNPSQALSVTVDGENLQLPSRSATTLAVVVNELMQNSLEHAFAGRPSGQVSVTLAHSPEAVFVLVQDDGIGMPDDHMRNLGLEIADTLVTEELQGELTFRRMPGGGTEACIRLPRETEAFGRLVSEHADSDR